MVLQFEVHSLHHEVFIIPGGAGTKLGVGDNLVEHEWN